MSKCNCQSAEAIREIEAEELRDYQVDLAKLGYKPSYQDKENRRSWANGYRTCQENHNDIIARCQTPRPGEKGYVNMAEIDRMGVLLYKNSDTPDNTEKLKKFIRWVLNEGYSMDRYTIYQKAKELGITDILEEK